MWKSYLKSQAKKYVGREDIFDIVLYGSAVKGEDEPKDIDILFIFFDSKLKERLEVIQKFKQGVREKVKGLDVKSINLAEIFDSSFLARQGVLVEGYSLIKGGSFAKRMGFEGSSIFSYNLRNLNHNEKTKFTYALIGRAKNKGMIEKVGGRVWGRGAVMVPIEKSLVFEEFLEEWDVNFRKKNILVSMI